MNALPQRQEACDHAWTLGTLRLITHQPLCRKCRKCGRLEYLPVTTRVWTLALSAPRSNACAPFVSGVAAQKTN